MKKAGVIILIVLTILFIICGGCKQRGPKKLSYTPGRMVLPDSIPLLIQGEEQDSEDDGPDYVSVPHQWKDLDDSVFLSTVPSQKTIEKWKREFEAANPADSVWKPDITRFEDAEHYLAVTDFIELWHQVAADIDLSQTEWRLLQWDPDPTSIPEGGFAKVTHLRELYESLMCYDTGSQWDMTFYAWLWSDFMGFYNKVLRREIGKRVNQDIHLALKKEASARERFYWKESAAFQKMEGDSLGGGSSFPYRVGMFGKESLEAEAKANEIFLFTLMENGRLMEVPQGFEPNVVLQEYKRLADVLEHEEEYECCYPKAEKIKELFAERKAWNEWMNQREKVSSLLNGNQKKAFDAATRILCREKLILLKNRYNVNNAFCPSYIVPHLASRDWPDKLILEHNLEELLAED